MSAPDQNAYQTWWLNVVGRAVPWLAGGPNGQAEAKAWPAFLDFLIAMLITARYQAYPSKCAQDAMAHLGGDRNLVQGPSETEQNFRTRMKTAWGNSPITIPAPGLPSAQAGGPSSGWALAGTWLQLLEELYWGGFTSITIVQQNGLGYSLSGAPTAGADNSGLLVITPWNATTSPLASWVDNSRSIPSSTPWFWFDGNTDLCNRFAVITTANNSITPADAARFKQIVLTWRPNAICYGFFGAVNSSSARVMWDFFPAGRTWDTQPGTWDGGAGGWAQLVGSF